MRASRKLQEWQNEARVEGELKKQLEVLLLALETRGKGPVPSDLVETIQATEDMELLMRWFRASLGANSFDDFRAAMQPVGKRRSPLGNASRPSLRPLP